MPPVVAAAPQGAALLERLGQDVAAAALPLPSSCSFLHG